MRLNLKRGIRRISFLLGLIGGVSLLLVLRIPSRREESVLVSRPANSREKEARIAEAETNGTKLWRALEESRHERLDLSFGGPPPGASAGFPEPVLFTLAKLNFFSLSDGVIGAFESAENEFTAISASSHDKAFDRKVALSFWIALENATTQATAAKSQSEPHDLLSQSTQPHIKDFDAQSSSQLDFDYSSAPPPPDFFAVSPQGVFGNFEHALDAYTAGFRVQEVQTKFPWAIETLITSICFAVLAFGAIWLVPYWIVAGTIRFAKWIADGFTKT
jgi:hypothetical protein